MVVTRRAICGRSRNRSPAASPRLKNCWKSSMASGTIRSIRSSTNTLIDCPAGELLRSLRSLRQVVEGRNDVLGKCIGQRRAFVGIANKADAAARQIRETIGSRKHAHARTKSGFRQHRYGKTGEHGGGDGAGVRTRIEYAEGAADRFQTVDGDAS